MNTNIVILGGGTAGWMTALFMRHTLPQARIVLIKNSEIGVIGVGEATTPHFMDFLRSIGVDVLDFLNRTNGTLKAGINFENWNGDGKRYLHPFVEQVAEFSVGNLFSNGCEDFYLKNVMAQKLDLEDYIYSYKLAYQNKIDFNYQRYACHFDSALVSRYLEELAITRNIQQIEGYYKGVVQDEQGYIKTIVLDQDRKIDCDFVFDCSGFSRLLVGNHFDQQWISYADHLPIKQAIPFWLEREENIRPYTTATAMKNGWMWNIPLQSRIGAGYVFDSDYISADEAKHEIENFLGQEIVVRKVIDFRAGRYQNFWVKNCMAVGLSSSFIEPLESTSLYLVLLQFGLLKHFINEIERPNSHSVKVYNKLINETTDNILNFIYLHYMTKRQDSDFWKNLARNYPIPSGLEEIVESVHSGDLRPQQLLGDPFSLSSYLHVCNGLGMFENGICLNNMTEIYPSVLEYSARISDLEQTAILHSKFLEDIKH